MSRTLSKSKLMAFRQCHRRLWLEVHRPELRIDSEAAQARFNAGYEVGDVAQRLYDPAGCGVLIDAQYEGYAEALARTRQLLNTDQPVFEAGFSAGGTVTSESDGHHAADSWSSDCRRTVSPATISPRSA